MKSIYLLIVLTVLMPSLAHALTLEWDRNTEPDMLEYRVYTCSPAPCTVVSANTIGIVPQPAVGVKPSFVLPANVSGMVGVLAIDKTLNRSGLSVPIPFSTVSDTTPPGVPTGVILKP